VASPDRGPIDRIGLIVHTGRDAAVAAARMLIDWLREQRVASRSLRGEALGADETASEMAFTEGLDLVVSVGGDGTLLRAARVANRAVVPLLGVKVGRMGFLTEVEPAGAVKLLGQILEGRMLIEERMAVVATPMDGPSLEPQWALNEVIVEKVSRHRLVSLRALVGDEYVATFSADGVIVATPTGSTAYSFSARGPIVSPRASCLLLTPVSPHMVFDRSIVLAPDESVTLEVLGEEPAQLSADGQSGPELPVGSRVLIQRADQPARLVRREGAPSFFALLREKFQLPGELPPGVRPAG
jgi:NAD+ kinase